MAKKTAKKPAKPATAKGKVVKPVKAWWWKVKGDRQVDARMVFDRRITWWDNGEWCPVLIVPAKGYTVTPTRAGRGKR